MFLCLLPLDLQKKMHHFHVVPCGEGGQKFLNGSVWAFTLQKLGPTKLQGTTKILGGLQPRKKDYWADGIKPRNIQDDRQARLHQPTDDAFGALFDSQSGVAELMPEHALTKSPEKILPSQCPEVKRVCNSEHTSWIPTPSTFCCSHAPQPI